MPPTGDAEPRVFGYVGRGASNVARGRLADYAQVLAAALSVEVPVFEAASYTDLAAAVMSGFVDIAWLPPIPLIRLQRQNAIVPLVAHLREGRTHFQSALIVRTSAPYATVGELSGARPAWVDLDSASGYVMPRLALADAGLDPRAAFGPERFCGSHEAVVRAVATGRADFGATYAGVDDAGQACRGPWLDVVDERGRPADVRVLATFGAIPGDATGVPAGLSADYRDRIAGVLRGLSAKKKNRALLRRVFGVDEFSAWEPSDHERLDRLMHDGIERGLLAERETSYGRP